MSSILEYFFEKKSLNRTVCEKGKELNTAIHWAYLSLWAHYLKLCQVLVKYMGKSCIIKILKNDA